MNYPHGTAPKKNMSYRKHLTLGIMIYSLLATGCQTDPIVTQKPLQTVSNPLQKYQQPIQVMKESGLRLTVTDTICTELDFFQTEKTLTLKMPVEIRLWDKAHWTQSTEIVYWKQPTAFTLSANAQRCITSLRGLLGNNTAQTFVVSYSFDPHTWTVEIRNISVENTLP